MAIAKALLYGAIGGALFNLADVPLAWMLGSLFFTGVGGRICGPVAIPRLMRDGLAPILGVLLGTGFTPEIFEHMAAWPIGLLSVAIYVALATAAGLAYFRLVAKFDPLTAFFATVPGGISDITLVGEAMGADLGRLALIHSMRVVIVVTVVPLAIGLFGYAPDQTAIQSDSQASFDIAHLAALAVCAVSGFLLGRFLRLPAAPVIGPLMVSAAVHLAGIAEIMPPWWMVVIAQVVLGAFIGVRLCNMAGGLIRTSLLYGIVWGVAVVALAFGIAVLSSSLSGISLASMLLGLAPGGLPEVAVLTLALGVDIAFVTTCHLTRLVAVYMMVPFVMNLRRRRSERRSTGR